MEKPAPVFDRPHAVAELPPVIHVTSWAAEQRPLVHELENFGVTVIVCPIAGPQRPLGAWIITPTELGTTSLTGRPTLVLGNPADIALQRRALRSGALGVVASGSRTAQLRAALVAVAGGYALLPEGVARALAERIAEPPVELQLDARQRRLVQGLADGSSVDQLAGMCGISERHVRRELGRIWDQAEVPNRTVGLIEMARWGYLED